MFEAKMRKRRGAIQAFSAEKKSWDFEAAMEKESVERRNHLSICLALALHSVPVSFFFF